MAAFKYWNGTQWVKIGGPAGATGPMGPTGYTGYTGPAGSGGLGFSLGSKFVNVRDYGALPSTDANPIDCSAAITAAKNAALQGGTVFFPAHTTGESYYVANPVSPLRAQTWVGQHNMAYDSDEFPQTTCEIRAMSSFNGSAVIVAATGTPDVTIRNIALVGRGELHATALHAIHFGEPSGWGGERNWQLENMNIHAFSESAINGHCWVLHMNKVLIARCKWGMSLTGAYRMYDNFLTDCFMIWNIEGGLDLGGRTTGGHGQVHVLRGRYERNGCTQNLPNNNRNTNAPGIRIRALHDSSLVNVTTDANSGPGIDIEGNASGVWNSVAWSGSGGQIYSVDIIAPTLIRDGSGDNTGTWPGIGFRLKTAWHVHVSDLNVTWGDPDDTAPPPPSFPMYGAWIENAPYCSIKGGRVTAAGDVAGNPVRVVGDITCTNINLPSNLLFNVPIGQPHANATFKGCMYIDSSGNLKMYSGTGWKTATFV